MSGLGQAQREQIRRIAEKHGVVSVRLFGSVARGTSGAKSDIDLLVRFQLPASLIQVIGFKQELESTLRLRVDVVEEGGLSPFLQEKILSEAVAL